MAAWGLSLNRNPKSIFQGGRTVYLPASTVGTRIPNTWHRAVLSVTTILEGRQRCLTGTLIRISLMISEVEHFSGVYWPMRLPVFEGLAQFSTESCVSCCFSEIPSVLDVGPSLDVRADLLTYYLLVC